MSNNDAVIASEQAITAQQEAKDADQSADQAEQYAAKATDRADEAIKDAKTAFANTEAAQNKDKSSIQQAGFALKEAREAISYGVQAREKAEEARNRAEHARNVAEEARSTAETARTYSEKEQYKAEQIAQEAWGAKEKAESALEEAKFAQSQLEEIIKITNHALEKAEMAEMRYRLIIEASNDGIWDWNIKTNETYWNGRFFQMLGLNKRNIFPNDVLFELVHPDDQHRLVQAVEEALTHNQPFEDTFRIKNAQENYLYCLCRGKTILDEEQRPLRMTGMITNITQQKEYEQQIKQREEEARQAQEEAYALKGQAELANQRKTQALSHMAHEIRTPLNSINGYTEMLIQGMAGELTEKQARYLENVDLAGKHLLALINDILDISKIEAGKIQLAPEFVMIELLVEKVKSIVLDQARKKNIKLQYCLQPDIGGMHTDPKRFQQILINLISNAIKYNHDGGEVNINLSKTDDKRWVVCTVEDTGIGIASDKLTNIFEEFYRVGEDLSRTPQEGTGLGLSLTKRLVEVQGGRISVESVVNKGSTFTFKLPA